MCHVFVRGDSLAAVAVSDHDYPPRVAHTMLTRYDFQPCKACKARRATNIKWDKHGNLFEPT